MGGDGVSDWVLFQLPELHLPVWLPKQVDGADNYVSNVRIAALT
jgi:hypothetical protein